MLVEMRYRRASGHVPITNSAVITARHQMQRILHPPHTLYCQCVELELSQHALRSNIEHFHEALAITCCDKFAIVSATQNKQKQKQKAQNNTNRQCPAVDA